MNRERAIDFVERILVAVLPVVVGKMLDAKKSEPQPEHDSFAAYVRARRL